jgi:hypothetical protein
VTDMVVNTLPVFDIGATEPSHSMTYGVKFRTAAQCLDSPRMGTSTQSQVPHSKSSELVLSITASEGTKGRAVLQTRTHGCQDFVPCRTRLGNRLHLMHPPPLPIRFRTQPPGPRTTTRLNHSHIYRPSQTHYSYNRSRIP